MINLLPPDIKTGYSYGRRNVGLRKWVVMFVIALLGLGGIGTFGLLTLHQSSLEYSRQVESAEESLTKNDYQATQKRVKDISNSFKLVVKVLGQEVLFSQLLKQIAVTIPKNANLTGLNISQTKGGIDIAAVATDYNTASQVQVNLADPKNSIFSKADIISIACDSKQSETGGANQYPCSVNVRALFAANNPYLFINSKGTKP
jgi:Tfp pilus assembly protein PilN